MEFSLEWCRQPQPCEFVCVSPLMSGRQEAGQSKTIIGNSRRPATPPGLATCVARIYPAHCQMSGQFLDHFLHNPFELGMTEVPRSRSCVRPDCRSLASPSSLQTSPPSLECVRVMTQSSWVAARGRTVFGIMRTFGSSSVGRAAAASRRIISLPRPI